MILIDSTVWIDYFRGSTNAQTRWVRAQISDTRLALTDLILCEVLQGVRTDAEFFAVREALGHFQIFETAGEDLASASAQNYRTLRKGGHTVRKTIDCLIATFCLQEGHLLLHRDRDFDLFEEHLGLSVIHP